MSSRLSCSKVLQFSTLPPEKRKITISYYFNIFHATIFLKKRKNFTVLSFFLLNTLERYTVLQQKIACYICKVFRHMQQNINVHKLNFVAFKMEFQLC